MAYRQPSQLSKKQSHIQDCWNSYEIHDYPRLLFARAGNPLCPIHKESLEGKSASEIADDLFDKYDENESIIILTPLVQKEKVSTKILLTI